jgi:hypothetical protein
MLNNAGGSWQWTYLRISGEKAKKKSPHIVPSKNIIEI